MLPPRIYHARVERVDALDLLSVRVDVDFNFIYRTQVRIEGVDTGRIAAKWHNVAMRSLILLVGGHEVLLYMPPHQRGALLARVYRSDIVSASPEEGAVAVPGVTGARLEVALCLQYLQAHDYSRDMTLAVSKPAASETT